MNKRGRDCPPPPLNIWYLWSFLFIFKCSWFAWPHIFVNNAGSGGSKFVTSRFFTVFYLIKHKTTLPFFYRKKILTNRRSIFLKMSFFSGMPKLFWLCPFHSLNYEHQVHGNIRIGNVHTGIIYERSMYKGVNHCFSKVKNMR